MYFSPRRFFLIIRCMGLTPNITVIAEGRMPFKVIERDIAKCDRDAIVNAANYTLFGGGGVDWAIHWAAGHWERELLMSCYRLSLELTEEYGFKSVAFPLISSGICHYPCQEALAVAGETIKQFLAEHSDMNVLLCLCRTKE